MKPQIFITCLLVTLSCYNPGSVNAQTGAESFISEPVNVVDDPGTANYIHTDIYYSDSSFELTDIRADKNELKLEMRITPVTLEFISDDTNKVHIGFKAQEIQEIVPEIVLETPGTGMLSASFTEMIPVLNKAILELNDTPDGNVDETTCSVPKNPWL